jgi:hypothetical protein
MTGNRSDAQLKTHRRNEMNSRMTTWTALALALLGLAPAASAANAAARLNIDVQVTSNLSVAVNNAVTSTQAVSWNSATPNDRLAAPSTSTVVNDSGGQTERWQLSTNANSINTAGNPEVWAVSTDSAAVGADAFALQAVFGSSNTAAGGCPAFNAADWDQSYANEVGAAPQTYTSALFADPTLNAAGGLPDPDVAGNGRMLANGRRALCWRLVTPATTVTADTQNIQLTVTAIAP